MRNEPAPERGSDSELHPLGWGDIVQCQQTVLRFTAAFDAGDVGGMLAEFHPDGVWHRQDGVVRGRAGLEALMAARSPKLLVRHVITNLRVTGAGPGVAECVSYLLVFRDDGGRDGTAGVGPAPLRAPNLLGRYHDELRTRGGAWLLSSRRVSVDMKQS